MELKVMPHDLTVCKVRSVENINLSKSFYFIGRTDEELSLVCKTEDTPADTTDRDDGWKGFRIQGILDFSLIGILSRLSGILADNGIGIFAVSTYNTDYILVKKENFERALRVLASAGYLIWLSNHFINAPLPPGNEGCCSTTSYILICLSGVLLSADSS